MSLSGKIAESKLRAFSIGTMGKRSLSKREQEELRKKQDAQAAAQVFEEFKQTFDETAAPHNKTWIKAGTFNAGTREEDRKEKGKVYKPTSKLAELAQTFTSMKRDQERKAEREREMKRDERGKRKSNLEMFKEELKSIQEERSERQKYKQPIVRSSGKTSRFAPPVPEPQVEKVDDLSLLGPCESDDPMTTNIYLGNLHPKLSEQALMEMFGRFGPLASIKVMWPRTDEEKKRGKNCGFVAFMNRKDGERCLENLNGKSIIGYDLRMGWAKSVPIPIQPIYVPPYMLEMTLPPPPSGLPFNAQPRKADKHLVGPLRRTMNNSVEESNEFNQMLSSFI